jgi:ATP-dependent Lhr-like helicase
MEQRFLEEKPKEEIMKFIDKYLFVDENAANSIYEYFREQFLYAEIPHDKKMVIEFYRGFGDQKYIIVHSLYGRRVNDALSRAIAYTLSKIKKRNVRINLSDNGFSLTTDQHQKIQVLRALREVCEGNLRQILDEAIDKTEVLRRRFRHCAGRSLMILRSYKGHKKSAGRQQVGSQILLKLVRDLFPNFPILKEAKREVMDDLMDTKHAEKIIKKLAGNQIKVKIIATDIPSPFALNLMARGYTDILKMEDKLEFIRRMHHAILKRIENK